MKCIKKETFIIFRHSIQRSFSFLLWDARPWLYDHIFLMDALSKNKPIKALEIKYKAFPHVDKNDSHCSEWAFNSYDDYDYLDRNFL